MPKFKFVSSIVFVADDAWGAIDKLQEHMLAQEPDTNSGYKKIQPISGNMWLEAEDEESPTGVSIYPL